MEQDADTPLNPRRYQVALDVRQEAVTKRKFEQNGTKF